LIVQQFFNLAIMERALPLVLAGLRQTIILCLIVIPLGLAGGLTFALVSLSRSRACAGPRLRELTSSAPFRRWYS
jgi:polar amino acid transport system permease protein